MSTEPPVIFFDGVCNLCHSLVQFVIRHDPQARFRFAALQSAAARRLLPPGLTPDPDHPDSVVLLDGGRVYTHSAAVLRILRRLGGGWALLSAAGLLPRALRDAAYRFVARRRYRWFGRQAECWLPTPELQARFL